MNIFGCCRRKPLLSAINDENYKAAGVIFTNGKLYLAGYQPHKRTPFISGIGGTKEQGESYTDTAIRESIEEIFDLIHTPPDMLDVIKLSINPSKTVINGPYVTLVYSFEDLECIIDIVNRYEVKSRSYDLMPISIHDLIFSRKVSIDKNTEITHLCVLPLIFHNKHKPLVDVNLIQDITQILMSGN